MTNYPAPKPLSHWRRFRPTEARTADEWQTPRQSAAIRAVANLQRIDADAACQHLLSCNTSDLNKKAAGTFLDWLKAQPIQLHPSNALNFCPVEDCNQLQAVTFEAASCSNGHLFVVAKAGEVG